MNKNEQAWFTKVIGPPDAYQVKLFDSVAKRTVVNKSRRTGISTILAFKALRKALAGGDSLIVSASERQSIFLMTEYIERFLKTLPIELKLIEDSKSVKRFENDGVVCSLPNQSNTIRGFNADYIFLDEAAHFLNKTDEAVYASVSPMLALGGSIDIASTPFGDDNIFARLWRDPNNGFEKVTINWRECPRLEREIENIRRSEDEITFEQEFNNVFRGEVSSEFPMSLLEKAVDPEIQYEVNPAGDIAGFDVGRRQFPHRPRRHGRGSERMAPGAQPERPTDPVHEREQDGDVPGTQTPPGARQAQVPLRCAPHGLPQQRETLLSPRARHHRCGAHGRDGPCRRGDGSRASMLGAAEGQHRSGQRLEVRHMRRHGKGRRLPVPRTELRRRTTSIHLLRIHDSHPSPTSRPECGMLSL